MTRSSSLFCFSFSASLLKRGRGREEGRKGEGGREGGREREGGKEGEGGREGEVHVHVIIDHTFPVILF